MTTQEDSAPMAVSGSVRIDLTDVPEDRRRFRAATLDGAPDGARVVLYVGGLYVDWPALDLLRTNHVGRVHIDVQGEPHAVRRWVGALRTGDACSGLGWPA